MTIGPEPNRNNGRDRPCIAAKLGPLPLAAWRRQRPLRTAEDLAAALRAGILEDVVEALDAADRVAKVVERFWRWDEVLGDMSDVDDGRVAIESGVEALYEVLQWAGTQAVAGHRRLLAPRRARWPQGGRGADPGAGAVTPRNPHNRATAVRYGHRPLGGR